MDRARIVKRQHRAVQMRAGIVAAAMFVAASFSAAMILSHDPAFAAQPGDRPDGSSTALAQAE